MNARSLEDAFNLLLSSVLESLDGDYCVGLRPIVNTCGLPDEVCRGFLAEARQRGLVEYHRGLMNESGEVAGAGYNITLAGMDFVRSSDRRHSP